MAAVKRVFNERRVSPLLRWNLIVLAPPLTISEDELETGLEAIDAALDAADTEVAAPA